MYLCAYTYDAIQSSNLMCLLEYSEDGTSDEETPLESACNNSMHILLLELNDSSCHTG